jgi:hypothetical protein
MEKVSYQGWQNCVRLSNDEIELIAPTEIGPRIMRIGFIGEENEFVEFEDDLGKTGDSFHRFYGGHRLWHSPEDPVRTYAPDNDPLIVTELPGGGVRLTQPVEATTGIQKEMDISLAVDKNEVTVVHRMYNRGLWPVQLALWALSQMAQGGVGISPLPPRASHEGNLLPASQMALWAYTDMSDPRWTWGREYVLLRQDPQIAAAQKLGFTNTDGWMAYARKGHLLVKFIASMESKHYPDMGVNTELFTNDAILELENLGPMENIDPGESAELVEHWLLVKGIKEIETEADVVQEVLPHIQ